MQSVDRHDAEGEVVDREDGGIEAGHTGALILLGAAVASAPLLFRHFGFRGFVISYAVALLAWLLLSSCPVVRRRLGGVLVLAIGLRLLFLVTDPQLSADVYRYLWDGKVFASGRNPYALPPNAAELAPLRGEWHSRINHPEIPTIYPPHAQLLFLVGRPLVVWRLLLLLADIAVLTILRGRAAMAYALFPLALVETAWSAHIEAIAALLLLVAYVRHSGAAAGAAVGVKLIPIAALPALLARASRRGRWLLAFTVALIAPAIPFLLAGRFMPGMRDYATRWIFNSPLFSAVFFVVDRLRIAEHLKSLWTAVKDPLHLEPLAPFVYSHLYPDFVTRAILAIVAATAIAMLVRRRAPAAHSVGALLLCSPAIHPWYWLVLVPLALLERTRLWIALALCAPFSYLLYDGSPPWVAFALCYALPLVIVRFRPSAIAT